jgi:hypothetical protein
MNKRTICRTCTGPATLHCLFVFFFNVAVMSVPSFPLCQALHRRNDAGDKKLCEQRIGALTKKRQSSDAGQRQTNKRAVLVRSRAIEKTHFIDAWTEPLEVVRNLIRCKKTHSNVAGMQIDVHTTTIALRRCICFLTRQHQYAD